MLDVVIVDDELSSLCLLMEELCDLSDFRATFFHKDPLSLLSYLDSHEVDVAFLDIQMPLIDGFEFAQKLIRKKSDIKIVFVTGYAYEKAKIFAKTHPNVVATIEKPVSKQDFLKVLNVFDDPFKKIYISTFGAFDVFYNQKPIVFYSKKSKELLAFLIDREGKNVTMGETLSNLWPDVPLEKAKILYRDAVWKLRKALRENGLESLVVFDRASLRVKKDIACDYFEALSEKKSEKFRGSYLSGYDWSIETENYLSSLLGF